MASSVKFPKDVFSELTVMKEFFKPRASEPFGELDKKIVSETAVELLLTSSINADWTRDFVSGVVVPTEAAFWSMLDVLEHLHGSPFGYGVLTEPNGDVDLTCVRIDPEKIISALPRDRAKAEEEAIQFVSILERQKLFREQEKKRLVGYWSLLKGLLDIFCTFFHLPNDANPGQPSEEKRVLLDAFLTKSRTFQKEVFSGLVQNVENDVFVLRFLADELTAVGFLLVDVERPPLPQWAVSDQPLTRHLSKILKIPKGEINDDTYQPLLSFLRENGVRTKDELDQLLSENECQMLEILLEKVPAGKMFKFWKNYRNSCGCMSSQCLFSQKYAEDFV
jgi:hypothetical protein